MGNSHSKEKEGRSPSMALLTTPETEITQTNQESETAHMNNSTENEHGAQSPTVKPPEDKKIEAERDRVLQSLLKAVKEKNDEIFKDTKKKQLSDSTPMLPKLKSERVNIKRGVIIITTQEPSSSKAAPSNKEIALTLRKRKRKQKRPSRAPMGDGLNEILEAKTWAKQAPLRASDNKKNKKKKENYNFSKFAWSLGRKEAEKDFNNLIDNKPKRRSARMPPRYEECVDYNFPQRR